MGLSPGQGRTAVWPCTHVNLEQALLLSEMTSPVCLLALLHALGEVCVKVPIISEALTIRAIIATTKVLNTEHGISS